MFRGWRCVEGLEVGGVFLAEDAAGGRVCLCGVGVLFFGGCGRGVDVRGKGMFGEGCFWWVFLERIIFCGWAAGGIDCGVFG